MQSLTSLFRRVKKFPAKNVGRALQLVKFGYGDVRIYEMVPDSGPGVDTSIGRWDREKARAVILVLLQVALGLTRDASPATVPTEGNAEGENGTPMLQMLSSRLATLEALKLVCCAALVYLETRRNCRYSPNPRAAAEVEAQPLREGEVWHGEANNGSPVPCSNSKSLLFGETRSSIAVCSLALLLVGHAYLTEVIINSGVPNTHIIHLSTLYVPLVSATFLRLLNGWRASSQQWLGILLQIFGLLSFESQSSLPNFSSPSVVFLVTLALIASLICLAIQNVYRRNDTLISNKFNTRLFAFGLTIHFFVFILSNLFPSGSALITSSDTSFRSVAALVLRGSTDIASLNLIYNHGAVLFGTLTCVSTTLLLMYWRILGGSSTISEMCSLAVALLGFFTFCSADSQHYDSADSPSESFQEKKSPLLRISLPAVFFLMLSTVVYIGSYLSVARREAESTEPVNRFDFPSIQSTETFVFTDIPYIPPPRLPPPEPICSRVPLPSEEFFTGNRTYHEFDDVLLIVFFSHARYDANLDYYKKVYSEFFPNMVFVGPKNREDKGFEHSYDVLVDSYESEEDISDWNNYKMAGRMAHHMLYTVLTTPPYSSNCYKGFLWAPFDTLLNVPRLQLFDQDRIWYFSPWGEYVPNPAVDEEKWKNASSHAPPARISPDPKTDFEETYRGWWVDWWWGDPHYGIPVCKYAFERVPPEDRERMAQRFTKNETRYIGGSADTLYIPVRLVDQFIDLLGTFLSTSCFLEIAVPTVVHLLVPEDENILFVDHWWIWEPPFNSSFVRDRWQKGLEVDTFHTFHWGDKDSDGVWRANPGNIEDVRELFRESAIRQKVEWTS